MAAGREAVTPLSVEEIYGEPEVAEELVEAALDRSLAPRSADMLFDIVGRLGLGPRHRLLDVGSRDGRHLLQLAARFGCQAVGVELVRANIDRGRTRVASSVAHRGLRIGVARGSVEALPFRAGSFDFVWIRDVLTHIADLRRALEECRRVLARDGRAVLFSMFATPWLEPGDATRLWPPLAAVPRNADPAFFEEQIAAAGFRVVERDEVTSEWREHLEETGERRTSKQLLHAARLLRGRDRYLSEIGRRAYELELGNCLWGVYQMIGKLSGRVYVLSQS
ncbi:MAG TPA: class I SAM-dependent methyltransferase [Candidatus Limnocylindria bacterium]|nr:class I SAM-dependent methyltransferase [Candidatus Limnocylindria bacterium]